MERQADGKAVFLVVGVLKPLRYMVQTCWATHLMNFATHEALYCVFPEATLERNEMYMLSVDSVGELSCFEKYLLRGFRRGDGAAMRSRAEFEGCRSIGDAFTKRDCFSDEKDLRGAVFGPIRFEVGRRSVRMF